MGSRKRLNRAEGSGRPQDGQLTKSQLLKMEIFAPSARVSAYVTTFFRMRCDELVIRDVQPSSLGIIAVMARGSGHIRFLDGRAEPSHNLSLFTPTAAAATFEVQGPWNVFGAMLSPLGWASLTGLSAARHANRVCDGEGYLSPQLLKAGERIFNEYDRLRVDDMIEVLSTAILASLRPVSVRHKEFLKAAAEWLAQSLSPEVDDLLTRCNYTRRQVQRLAERYFGLPPTALARKYRALRAAVLLSRPSLTTDEIAAVQDHFYDQPHMIREIRLFAGRTPARIADPDTPYLSAFLDLRDFGQVGSRMAPIPKDLRA